MRQFVAMFLSIGALAIFGQTPEATPEATANKQINLASQELQKITGLVQAGALPRVDLEKAQQDLEDAQDEAILERTLYGDLAVSNLTDQLADEMIAAAQRRVERQQIQVDHARKLVADGIAPLSSVTPLEEELAIRARIDREITRYEYQYPGRSPILLIFFRVAEFEGEPRNLDFEQIRWESRERLRDYDFLEGDANFIRAYS